MCLNSRRRFLAKKQHCRGTRGKPSRNQLINYEFSVINGNPVGLWLNETRTTRALFGQNSNSQIRDILPGSSHVGGYQTVLADGAVRFLSDSMDAATRRDLADTADGQPIGDF